MLTVQLLGGFKLTQDGQPIPGLTRPRGKSLLAYLLLYHATPQERTHLAYTFWPETSDSQARTNLRRELHQLRQSFPLFTMLSQSDGQSIQWQMPDDGALDVTEFTRLLTAAEETTDPVTQKTKYQAAIDYYQGDLLPGLYDDWVLAKREELRQAFIRALETFTALLIDDREYAAATTLAQRLLRYDPLYEAGYVQLMELYALQNDRARALHTYHRCATILERELGVPTSAELKAIYQRLLHADEHHVSEHHVGEWSAGNRSVGERSVGERRVGERRVGERRVSSSTTFHLVGRKTEWQTLLAAWRQASQDRAHMLLIEGEAGIGKTRLGEELLEWANRQAIPTARTRSYAAEGALAYAPVIEWLRLPALRTAIATLDPVWRTEAARLLPELLIEFPDLPHPEPLTERWQRQRLFEALARAMTVDAHPKLLLIDDLQWCDQETLEWLRFLLRFAPDAPLLILGTVRTEEVALEHPLHAFTRELQLNQQLSTIELTLLNATETAELAAQVSNDQLDSAAVNQLMQASEGNPLFIVEMARSGGWATSLADAQAAVGDPQMLPPKVYAVIQHRLAQLSPAARTLAALAATIGRSFTFDLLCAATEQGADEVVNGLDELWRRKVIRERGANEYDFSHDRIREAAYAELSPMRHKLLHRHVVRALESVYADALNETSGALGYHCEKAGMLADAIQWYRQAGETAWDLHAFYDAINFYRSAIRQFAELPATDAHMKQELDIQVTLGEALAAAMGFTTPDRGNALSRARELAVKLNDIEAMAQILPGLAGMCMALGDAPAMHLYIDEAVALAAVIENPVQKVLLHKTDARASFHAGNFEKAHRLVADEMRWLLKAYNSTKDPLWQVEYFTTCPVFAFQLWIQGFPDQAQSLLHLYRPHRDQVLEPYRRGNFIFMSLLLMHNLDEIQILTEDAAQLSALGIQHEMILSQYSSGVFDGWLLAKQGDFASAIASFHYGLDGMQQVGHVMYHTHRLAMFIEVLLWANQLEEAAAVLQEAFSVSERCDQHFWDVELYRLQGDLLLAQHQSVEAAEATYHRAITIAQGQGAKSLELRAVTALSRLWQRQGQADRAHQALMDIYGWFTEGFDTHELRAARALLTELRA